MTQDQTQPAHIRGAVMDLSDFETEGYSVRENRFGSIVVTKKKSGSSQHFAGDDATHLRRELNRAKTASGSNHCQKNGMTWETLAENVLSEYF